jgi:hypothetical protein
MTSVEQALQQFYSPTGTIPQKVAEKILMDYQSNPDNFQSSLALLHSQNTNEQFFAAQSLYINLSRDWTQLSSDSLTQIATKLFNWLQTPALTTAPFVTSKICTTFTLYLLKSNNLKTQSEMFCSTLYAKFTLSNEIYYKNLLVSFLTYLPEEGSKITLTQSGESTSMKISSIGELAFSIILPILNSDDPTTELALNCVSSWSTHSTIPTDSLVPLLEILLKKLVNLDLIETTTEVLCVLLADKRIGGMNTVSSMIFPVITSQFFIDATKEAIVDENEEYIMAYYKLMTKYGETFAEFLVMNIPLTDVFFELMLLCTMYSNSQIAEISFFFWFTIEDYLDSSNELNTRNFPLIISDYGHGLFTKLLAILQKQITYPSTAELSQWTQGI